MIAGAYAWNLLVSAAIAFGFSCLVLLALRRPTFARRPRLAVFLAALPFAKFAIELARGIPANGFFWEQLAGATRKGGTFQCGVGVSKYGPVVNLTFGTEHHGTWRPLAAADGMATMLDRHVHHGSWVGGLVLASIAAVAMVREIVALSRSALACRRHANRGDVVAMRRVGLRCARVVVSTSWRGVPFATGFLRPRVCISDLVWSALDPEEREAIVLHELGHLRWFDGALLAFARLTRAVLWFVPGAGAALRALTTQCELAADADAVAHGASAEVLASALVRTGELLAPSTATPLLALFRDERTTFVRRVHSLLQGDAPAKRSAAPLILFVLLALTVLRMTTFGNV